MSYNLLMWLIEKKKDIFYLANYAKKYHINVLPLLSI